MSRLKSEAILQAMADAGKLTPDNVVKEARKPNSPLHKIFAAQGCWDKDDAAQRWCVTVARELIRSFTLKLTIQGVTFDVPKFIHIPGPRQGYTSTGSLRDDTDVAQEALVEEFARAGAAMARAQNLAKFFDLERDVGKTAKEITELEKKVAKAARLAKEANKRAGRSRGSNARN